MTRLRLFSRCAVAILLFAVAGCRSTHEFPPEMPSEQLDPSRSLGSLEVRYARTLSYPPTLYSAFRRTIIEPEMGFAGTYVFAVAYPTMKVGEDYSSLTLKGEALEDGRWRFNIPYKSGWKKAQDLLLRFDGAKQGFLFRYLEGQSCLNDYSLENPGGPPLQVSVRFKQPACLVPCSPSQRDPARCSNRWR